MRVFVHLWPAEQSIWQDWNARAHTQTFCQITKTGSSYQIQHCACCDFAHRSRTIGSNIPGRSIRHTIAYSFIHLSFISQFNVGQVWAMSSLSTTTSQSGWRIHSQTDNVQPSRVIATRIAIVYGMQTLDFSSTDTQQIGDNKYYFSYCFLHGRPNLAQLRCFWVFRTQFSGL